MEHTKSKSIDPRSGFCNFSSIFYSKRKPLQLPQNPSLDVITFISSHAHHGKVAFIDATGRHFTFHELWLAMDAVTASLSVTWSSSSPPTPFTSLRSVSPSCPSAPSPPPPLKPPSESTSIVVVRSFTIEHEKTATDNPSDLLEEFQIGN